MTTSPMSEKLTNQESTTEKLITSITKEIIAHLPPHFVKTQWEKETFWPAAVKHALTFADEKAAAKKLDTIFEQKYKEDLAKHSNDSDIYLRSMKELLEDTKVESEKEELAAEIARLETMRYKEDLILTPELLKIKESILAYRPKIAEALAASYRTNIDSALEESSLPKIPVASSTDTFTSVPGENRKRLPTQDRIEILHDTEEKTASAHITPAQVENPPEKESFKGPLSKYSGHSEYLRAKDKIRLEEKARIDASLDSVHDNKNLKKFIAELKTKNILESDGSGVRKDWLKESWTTLSDSERDAALAEMVSQGELEPLTQKVLSREEKITQKYKGRILKLYAEPTPNVIGTFNKEGAKKLIREMAEEYQLPIREIKDRTDNYYEFDIVLDNGTIIEHIGKVGTGKTREEKITLVNIAKTILAAVPEEQPQQQQIIEPLPKEASVTLHHEPEIESSEVSQENDTGAPIETVSPDEINEGEAISTDTEDVLVNQSRDRRLPPIKIEVNTLKFGLVMNEKLADAITKKYREDILKLYTFDVHGHIEKFDKEGARKLLETIITTHGLPIIEVRNRTDNHYEFDLVLKEGGVIEHIGALGAGEAPDEQITLLHFAQKLIDNLPRDPAQEALAKFYKTQHRPSVSEKKQTFPKNAPVAFPVIPKSKSVVSQNETAIPAPILSTMYDHFTDDELKKLADTFNINLEELVSWRKKKEHQDAQRYWEKRKLDIERTRRQGESIDAIELRKNNQRVELKSGILVTPEHEAYSLIQKALLLQNSKYATAEAYAIEDIYVTENMKGDEIVLINIILPNGKGIVLSSAELEARQQRSERTQQKPRQERPLQKPTTSFDTDDFFNIPLPTKTFTTDDFFDLPPPTETYSEDDFFSV